MVTSDSHDAQGWTETGVMGDRPRDVRTPVPGAGSLAGVLRRLETVERLDRVADVVAGRSTRASGPVVDGLRGRWLGHPVHPALTDLPIGFWTSAWVLDLVRIVRPLRADRTATALVAAGVVTALPTAVTGLLDVPSLPRERRRVAVVHAASNLAATACFTWSLIERLRDRGGRGRAVGMLAATLATIGGVLGGYLGHVDDARRTAVG